MGWGFGRRTPSEHPAAFEGGWHFLGRRPARSPPRHGFEVHQLWVLWARPPFKVWPVDHLLRLLRQVLLDLAPWVLLLSEVQVPRGPPRLELLQWALWAWVRMVAR